MRERIDRVALPEGIDTYHYHVRGGDNYHDRTLHYHNHPGSFIFGEDGELIHDHSDDPARYASRPNIYSDDAPTHNSKED